MSDISRKNLFITVEEANKIFQSIRPAETKYRVLLLLVAFGCRPCEAVRMHINDFIKPDCTQFYASNTKVARNGAPPRRDLKIVPVWVGEEIRSYIQKAYSYGELKGGFLFPTGKPHKYEHMSAGTFFAWFAEHRRRVGLDADIVAWKPHYRLGRVPQYHVGIYSLRRLFATEMAFEGADQRVIAALMGHKDVKTTSQYQDKMRLLQLAPTQVAKMPRFFQAGQVSLAEYFQPAPMEVVEKANFVTSQNFAEHETGAASGQTCMQVAKFKGRPHKPRCNMCNGTLRLTRLGSLFCKKCWEYKPAKLI